MTRWVSEEVGLQRLMSITGKIDISSGLFLLHHAPRAVALKPVPTESGYVNRSENAGYRVQCSLPLLDE